MPATLPDGNNGKRALTSRTDERIRAGQAMHAFGPALAGRKSNGGGARDLGVRSFCQSLLCSWKVNRYVGTRVQAAVANLDETLGQYVKQKPTNELGVRNGDVLAVLGKESNLAVLARKQTLIADPNAVGISAQVPKHVLVRAKRTFGINDPIL